MKWFGCRHRNWSFPRTTQLPRLKVTYQVCLGCGAERLYDWQTMTPGQDITLDLHRTSTEVKELSTK
jgi:hypothetical protein